MKTFLQNNIRTFIVTAIIVCSSVIVRGATFTVNTTTDAHAASPGAGTGLTAGGQISFRSALEAANATGGNHTIIVPAGTYNLTLGMITLNDIAENITISGAGALTTVINMTTTSQDRILLIGASGTQPNMITSISGLTFQGGKLKSDDYGGGAIIAGGPSNSLTLTNCIFNNNTIDPLATALSGVNAGGAVRYNGGGTLTITNCTFSNNSVPKGDGGAVSYFLENLVSAGNGAVTITNSKFTNNSVTATGGKGGAVHIAAQGRINAGVTFTVDISQNTFDGNSASGTSGTGGAMVINNGFDVGNIAQVHYNRFINNTSTVAPDGLVVITTTQGEVNADNNWWGCNAGPTNGAGCDLAAVSAGGSSLKLAKWLQLKHTASPSSVVVGPPGSTTLTASFLSNSANDVISAGNLSTLIGLPITFNNAVKGVISSPQTTIQSSGTATATYTVNADACPPSGSADAKVDNATATATITIIDNIPPQITCPTPATLSCAADTAADYSKVITSDNCPPVTLSHVNIISNKTCEHKFTITRIFTATDKAGNTATCSQIITVNDQTPPTITCPPPVTVSCAGDIPQPNPNAITATDNCTGLVTVALVNDVVSNQTCPNRYTVTRTYMATDICGNTAICTQVITVNDQKPPSITCPAPVSVSCAAAVPAPDPQSVITSDNCGGSVTVTFVNDVISNQTCANRYTITRTYMAADICGNTATCTQTITVNDQTAPTITCPADITVYLAADANTCGTTVSWTVPTASDNCSGTPDVKSDHQPGDVFSVGKTVVTYTATDACGNTATCSFNVTVVDQTPPSIACPPDFTDVPTDPGFCSAAVSFVIKTDDNCPGSVTVQSVASGATTGIVTPGSSFNKGTTTVTSIAYDGSGNPSQSCSFTITVVDKQAPVITCPTGINLVGADACTGIVSVTPATANDNCDGPVTPVGVRSDGKLLTDPFPAGTTTITWTATDIAGNSSSCTQTVQLSPQADVSITKTGPAQVTAGTNVTYTITVVNNGPCVAKNVVVTDAMPAGATVLSVTSGAKWNFTLTTSTNVKGTALTLSPADGPQIITVSVHINSNVLGGGQLSNTAVVSNDVTDPNPGNNNATTTATVLSVADLSISKLGQPSVLAGSNLVYTITVNNSGPSDATNVVVTDPLPPGLTFVSLVTPAGWSATTPAVGSGGTITINRPSVAANSGSQTFTLTVNVPNAIPDQIQFSNTASVTTSSLDNNPSNNNATQTTQVINQADISVIKQAPPVVSAGGNITYTIIVQNDGPATAQNVTLQDLFPPVPATLVSVTAPLGWIPASVPPLGFAAPFNIIYIKPTLSLVDGPQIFQLVVNVNGNLPADIDITNTALVSINGPATDPNSGNNSGAATTHVIACHINCPADIVAYTGPGATSCGTNVTYAATTTGNCGDLTYSKPSGSFFPVGTTQVTVSSASTGQSCTFNVTVKDNTPPVPNCPTDYSVNADPGQCYATVNFTMSATDNCELTSTNLGFDGPLSVGSHTFSRTFTDVSGNSASCSFTITVVDNQPPVITCQSDKTVNADAGKCYASAASVNLVYPTATDNCGSTTIKGVRSDGKLLTDNYPTGATVITWTATDTHSNTASCTQTITVKDNQAPTITGISATPSVLWPPNHTMRDVTISYTSADNCGIANCSLSVSSNEPIDGTGDGDTSPDWIIVDGNHLKLRAERSAQGNGRIYTITITCTDVNGNSTSQTVNVVVSHNITAPLSGASYKIGSTVNFSGTFWDKPGNKHTAQWLIDGTSVNGSVTAEPSGTKNGTVTGSYKFGSAGVYKLQMNVKDQTGAVSYANTQGDLEAIVVIYDPNGGYTYGGGYFTSPAGSLKSNPTAAGKVSYGFNSNYFKGATNPKGETQMQFMIGNLEFNALNFDYLAISGAKAQYKGSGKIVGDQSGYSFIMTVIDGQATGGGGVDKIRLKIYNKNTGAIIYDNQPGASDADDPTTAVGTGSTIVVYNVGAATETNREPVNTTVVETAQSLEVSVMPNPSETDFRLILHSNDKVSPVNIKVVNINGQLLKVLKGRISDTFRFGHDLSQGVYMVEVTQGSQKQILKLIKF